MKTAARCSFSRRLYRRPIALLSLAVLAGCSSHPRPSYQAQEQAAAGEDIAIVDSIADSGIRSAIITQHALFPYHFVPGGDALDELGERDLGVLISHYRTVGGGELSIRRGETPDNIYNARVRRVQQAMTVAGVNPASVRITDTPAGGEGMASTAALRAQARTEKQQPFQAGDASSSGVDTSSGGTPSQNGAAKQ